MQVLGKGGKLQEIGQTESVIDTRCSDEASLSIAESFEQPLTPVTGFSLELT